MNNFNVKEYYRILPVNDIEITNLVLELSILLNDFSRDSKASKRCFCNRAEPLLFELTNKLMERQHANTK